MAEYTYTYKDIIIDPSSEEAKNAVGKECYFGDSPAYCLNNANSDNFLYVLDHVEVYNVHPFVDTNSNAYGCIIVKKEQPSYKERFKRWVEENDLKEGDYVKVTRKVNDYEDEWQGLWLDYIDESVGKTLKVKDIDTYVYTIGLENGFYYPYFVLEKVEPEPKYVPFESPQEFISAYNKASKEVMPDTESMLLNSGMWLKWQDTYVGITYISRHGVNYGAEFLDWDELLDEYLFLDGSPVGKEVNGEATPHEKKMQDDLPIGTRFLDGGQLVEVVDGHRCGDCVFVEIDCSQKRCVSEERSDKKNVYFKEVKGERLQAED